MTPSACWTMPTSSTSVSRCEARARGSVAGGGGRAAFGGPRATASRRTAAGWRPIRGRAPGAGLGGCAREPVRIVEQADDGAGERGGVVERHEHAGAGREQVLGVV